MFTNINVPTFSEKNKIFFAFFHLGTAGGDDARGRPQWAAEEPQRAQPTVACPTQAKT
jgi:hypothetical protein